MAKMQSLAIALIVLVAIAAHDDGSLAEARPIPSPEVLPSLGVCNQICCCPRILGAPPPPVELARSADLPPN